MTLVMRIKFSKHRQKKSYQDKFGEKIYEKMKLIFNELIKQDK